MKKFTIFITFILLFSCDFFHLKDYYIENSLDKDVLFKFETLTGEHSREIKSQNRELIFSQDYIRGTVGVDDERYNDRIWNLRIVYNEKEIIIDEKKWKYVQHGKYYASYTITIDDDSINF